MGKVKTKYSKRAAGKLKTQSKQACSPPRPDYLMTREQNACMVRIIARETEARQRDAEISRKLREKLKLPPVPSKLSEWLARLRAPRKPVNNALDEPQPQQQNVEIANVQEEQPKQDQMVLLAQQQQQFAQNMEVVQEMQNHVNPTPLPRASSPTETSEVPMSSDYQLDSFKNENGRKRLQKRRPKKPEKSAPSARPPTPPNYGYQLHLAFKKQQRLVKEIQSMDLTKPAEEPKQLELRTVRDHIVGLNPHLTEEEIVKRIKKIEEIGAPNCNEADPHIMEVADELREFINFLQGQREIAFETSTAYCVKTNNFFDTMFCLEKWKANRSNKKLKRAFDNEMYMWHRDAKERMRGVKENLYCRLERYLMFIDLKRYQKLAIQYGHKVDVEDSDSD